MSNPTTNGSEDVNDFLERIKEIGKQRDLKDEERNRKLEEDIIQGRKERQARRAERARSISPTKSSPANTPTKTRISLAQKLSLSDFPLVSPGSSELPCDVAGTEARPSSGSLSSTGKNTSVIDVSCALADSGVHGVCEISNKPSPLSTAVPLRSPTLPWQRHLSSQVPDNPISRPLSMPGTENTLISPKDTLDISAAYTDDTSEELALKSVTVKDSAWLKPTLEPAIKSSIHRRTRSENEENPHRTPCPRVQLPDTASDSSRFKQEKDESTDPSDLLSTNSLYGGGLRISYGANTTVRGETGSPVPLNTAQKIDSPIDTRTGSHGLMVSSNRARTSPERFDRSTSPTKGMGGFVQSAMMKRSDSVNKRWSVHSSPNLSRVDSVSGNRDTSGEKSPQLFHSRSKSSHGSFMSINERPCMQVPIGISTVSSPPQDLNAKASAPTPDIGNPTGMRSPQISTNLEQEDKTPPVSPTKTIDRKRWSPTKSSWLEVALSKQESHKPKLRTAATPQPPTWMSEINKSKQKIGAEIGHNLTSASKHEVSVGGLIKLPPMGSSTKPSAGDSPIGITVRAGNVLPSSLEHLGSVKRISSSASLSSVSSSRIEFKSKSELPLQNNLRANLKPRNIPSGAIDSDQTELKNIFVKLRPTKTQNYVAPDELKDNISRGKAALNLTTGPQKTERKDEFKEAILKKKEDFRKAQLEGKGVTRSPSTVREINLPEALLKRNALGRKNSISEISDLTRSTSNLRLSRPSSTPSMISAFSNQRKEFDKVANGFNPDFATALASRLPLTSSHIPRSSSLAISHSLAGENDASTEKCEPGARLTHITKQRARGPRRAPPTLTSKLSISPAASTNDREIFQFASPLPQITPSSESAIREETNLPESIPDPFMKITEDSVSQDLFCSYSGA